MVALTQEDGTQVFGTVVVDPTDERFLLVTVDQDTIPANTLAPINAVINPLASGPGQGLPVAVAGQRYLFTEATGSSSGYADAWAGMNGQELEAKPNDIVEYDGSRWFVSFDSQSSPVNTQYVTNITTMVQYKWIGIGWVKSYQGEYAGGQWALIL